MTVFAGEKIAVRTMEDNSLVLGDIYSRSGATCHESADGWGSFIAFATDGEATRVDRAPLTGMPLYWTRIRGGVLCWSDLGLVTDLLPGMSIDWDFVAHSLVYSNLRIERTGLAGVSELLPGMRLEVSNGEAEARLSWSPWRHTARLDFRDVAELAPELERRIIRCADAWCSSRDSVLLELSGGVDSSIVAAALVGANTEVSAVNFVTQGADGDEWRYAEAVAAYCSIDLTPLPHNDDSIDLIASPTHRHVRPAAYGVLGGIDAAFEAAFPNGETAIFGGIGGDNIFDFDTSVAPILDAFGHFGASRRSLRAMRDVARVGDATIWEAARLSLRAWRAGPRGWRRDTSFCNPASLPDRALEHPWDAGEGDVPRGKRNHVRALRRILDFVDRPERWRGRDVVAPLLSQPVVEFCLTIPSWTWVTGGRDRAVARAAFAGRLPAEVIWRRGKGRLDSLCTSAYLRQRAMIADFLLGGRLATRGLLDQAAIEAYLARDLVEGDFDYFRLLEIADIERWVRSIEASPFFGANAAQR